jgi:hypothetical protein
MSFESIGRLPLTRFNPVLAEPTAANDTDLGLLFVRAYFHVAKLTMSAKTICFAVAGSCKSYSYLFISPRAGLHF